MNDAPRLHRRWPTDTLTIDVVDSHTGGEPTRVVVGGFPALRGTTLAERRTELASVHRRLATAIVDEPRGNEPMVGALLTEPLDAQSATGVIFFDRTMVLGMCGHGMIGLVETLYRLGRVDSGDHRIETPVGVVPVRFDVDREANTVTLDNVISYRRDHQIAVEVPTVGRVVGDIAYGGNVFFLVTSPAFDLDRPRAELLHVTTAVLRAVHQAGFGDVDHIELFGPPTLPNADARNFVLCPSGTFDRSPCGTGTSAKVAALAAAGTLAEGERWVQESITGSTFSVHYRWDDRSAGTIVPTVSGSATVTGRADLYIAAHEYR
ncbi:4-hydroxyproline epimerase [soil metagenome]